MLKAESTFWLPRLQANRAIDRLRQGNLDVGGDLLEALDIALSRGQEFHAVRALEGLAELHIARNEPEQTFEYSDRLLAHAQERDLREMLASAHRWRGEAFLLLNQPDEAIAELEHALQIADEVGRQRLIWDIHAALARAYQMRGDVAAADQHQAAVQAIVTQIATNLTSDDLRLGLPEFTVAAMKFPRPAPPDFIVRAASADDYPAAGELAATVFSRGDARVYERFLHHWLAARPHEPGFNYGLHRLGFKDQQVIAHARVRPYTLHYGSAQLHIAGISEICTDPRSANRVIPAWCCRMLLPS